MSASNIYSARKLIEVGPFSECVLHRSLPALMPSDPFFWDDPLSSAYNLAEAYQAQVSFNPNAKRVEPFQPFMHALASRNMPLSIEASAPIFVPATDLFAVRRLTVGCSL